MSPSLSLSLTHTHTQSTKKTKMSPSLSHTHTRTHTHTHTQSTKGIARATMSLIVARAIHLVLTISNRVDCRSVIVARAIRVDCRSVIVARAIPDWRSFDWRHIVLQSVTQSVTHRVFL